MNEWQARWKGLKWRTFWHCQACDVCWLQGYADTCWLCGGQPSVTEDGFVYTSPSQGDAWEDTLADYPPLPRTYDA